MTDQTDRVWLDAMSVAYERWLVPTVFRPFAADLACRVSAGEPRAVLELAAGTGVLTTQLLAAVPSAQVTATDFNAAMVEMGRRRAPGAVWQRADAMDLPFADGQFDLIACQFGVMFFRDKAAAFAEARRVLTTRGKLLLNTWGRLETHDVQAAVVAGLARAFPEDPPNFLSTVPHGYSDIDVIVKDLADAGLRCVDVETVTLDGHAASASELAAGYCSGTPLRAGIEARGDLAVTTAVVAEEIDARLGPGRVIGRMTAHVVEAMPAAT